MSPPSLAEVVERHRPELLAYLTRLLGDVHDAEDACQDALLRACGAFARLGADARTRAWLYKIATRSALNLRQKRRRGTARRVDADPDTFPAVATADALQRERLERVIRAVQALPLRQRAALMQRRFHGLTYDEVGVALGCSAATARANVYQALKKLRLTLLRE